MDDDKEFEIFTIQVEGGRAVGARLYPADARQRLASTLVLGHGAGAGHLSDFMTTFARALAARGLDIVTFNFPYIEAQRRVPDANALLEATWRSAIAAATAWPQLARNRLLIGGKSMGGRIASQVAAQPDILPGRVDGLVFLGYPLHPPNQPERRRDAHLGRIPVPMLFVQGERDVFGTAEEMSRLVAALPRASLYVVAGGNHSLETGKRSGNDRRQAFAAVVDRIADWVRALAAKRPTDIA